MPTSAEQANVSRARDLTPILEANDALIYSARHGPSNSSILGEDEWTINKPVPIDRESILSVQTDYYLVQIRDREERESARRNIEYLRDMGFQVKGELHNGQYLVKFSTPAKAEVTSFKSFIKAKLFKTSNK